MAMELRTEVTVSTPVGLHARPAALLVREAMKYPASLWVEAGDRRANAKSILQVLALGVKGYGRVTLVAGGERAEEALQALVRLVESGLCDHP